MATNILVVEDEPAIQELITINLEQAGFHPVRANSAEQAIESVRGKLPDLVLLDWTLPGMSGIEFARRLRSERRTETLPIIMLTARTSEHDKLVGLDTGVDDYVTKPFSPRELNARIKTVLRRRAPQATDVVVEVNGLRLDPVSQRVSGNGQSIVLGPTEYRLLHFLMTHTERVYTRAQLLDHVWGDHVYVEERTIDVHIRRLRKALEDSGYARLVETVRGAGYRLSANA
jgi:two-component system phosphate regulon response regulator PhoB